MNISKKVLGLVLTVSMVSMNAMQLPQFMGQISARFQNLSDDVVKVAVTSAITGAAHLCLKHNVLPEYSSALLITEVAGLVYVAGSTGKFVKDAIETADAFITKYTPVTGYQLVGLTTALYFAHKVGCLTKVAEDGSTVLPSVSQLLAAPLQGLSNYIIKLGGLVGNAVTSK